MVNKVPDVLCVQLMASKHFNRIVQDRLDSILWAGTCQGEGLYLIMDRGWDDVRATGFYAPIPNK
jgi:hypothetical protein